MSSHPITQLVGSAILNARTPEEMDSWLESDQLDLRNAQSALGQELRLLDAIPEISSYPGVQESYAYVLAEVDALTTTHRVIIRIGGNAGEQVIDLAETGQLPSLQVLTKIPAGQHEMYYWAKAQT